MGKLKVEPVDLDPKALRKAVAEFERTWVIDSSCYGTAVALPAAICAYLVATKAKRK